MAGVVVEMSGDTAKLFRDFAKLQSKQNELERGLKDYGKAGKRSGDQVGGAIDKAVSSAKNLALGLIGGGGVLGALSLINQAYETWNANIRETAAESRKAANEIVAFASIQAGGARAGAVRQAANLAVQYGVSDRGAAFNAVQALQSARGGDLGAGMDSAKTVFAATQLGMSLDRALELEVIGSSMNATPGATVRRAFVAGEASGRSPEVIAGGASSLQFFQNQDFASSAAAIISEPFGPELKTYLKAAGIALSGNSQLAKGGVFAQLGVGDGTQQDRLAALVEAVRGGRFGESGTTVEKLGRAGLVEKTEQAAVATLIDQYARVGQIQRTIEQDAIPGLFTSRRAVIEGELPSTMLSRQIDIAAAMSKDQQAFSERALSEELDQRLRGIAFRRAGIEQAFGADTIDAEGRSTVIDELRMRASSAFIPGGVDFDARRQFEFELDSLREQFRAMGQEVATATSALRQSNTGGSALVPPGVDR